ncbi:MAG: PilZ domain-containing protein [Planctomycetota bacterium]
MSQPRTSVGVDNRVETRQALDATVTVHFDSTAIMGSAQNISQQGVFFTAGGSVPVTVRIDGKDRSVRGELVRFDNMGDGRFGIAVRFVENAPDLVD